MYFHLKRILLAILPQNFILKNEFYFRKIYAFFLTGNSVCCNICNQHFSRFISNDSGEKICPRCGSLARHRRLWIILHNELTIHKQDAILDFSPSRIIMKKLQKSYPNYLTSDFQENKLVDRQIDITAIEEKANAFHWIICYHILEHIEDDLKAMQEVYRVLKKGGTAIIQTPFKEGSIYENSAIRTKEDRLAHFGQEDHVRIYSADGLKERLQSVGFEVRILEYTEEVNNVNGFKTNEVVILAKKR